MKRWSVLMAALLLAAPVVFGQAQTTARLTGRVVDDAGAPIAGATVNIRQTGLQIERTATTSATGEFIFSLLPTGPYEVTITAPGRQPDFYRLQLGVGETVPLNVTLAPGDAVTETITVTGTATALETTTVGQNIGDEEVEELPMLDRTIEDIAELAPNISFGPTPGTIAIAGAPSYDTRILLDGAEMSDPYFGSAPIVYIEDAIEEVQVLTSGVSARYGRFQGGVVNAITKSGGNEFAGTLRAELESQSWNEKTPFGERQTDDIQKIYQATLGGPIWRDRLWFFGGLRMIPDVATSVSTTYTSEFIERVRSEDRWQFKVRGALTANHMVDAGYLEYDATVTGYVGLVAGDDRAQGIRSDPRSITTLSYQGVLSPNTFVEVQGTQKDVNIISGGDPERGDPILENATATMFNNHWWAANDPSVRSNETLSANVTHALNTASFGSHTLEGGLQRVVSTTGGENRQSSTGYNFLAFNTSENFFAGAVGGEPTFNVITEQARRWVALPLGGDQKIENNALYLQDTVAFDKLRLDLGLRYETYEGSGPDPSYNLDLSGWAPRLGVTYSVTPVWQLQATYGRYISRYNDKYGNSVTGVSAAPRIVNLYTGPTMRGINASQIEQLLRNESVWGVVMGYSGVDQPTIFQDPNISAPYADEINLSLRHGLPQNSGSVVLSYIHRDYKEFVDDYWGLTCDLGISFGLPCPAGSTREIRNPNNGERLATVDTGLWSNESRAKREYRALTLVWDYRPTTRSQVGGNYTYGTTRGNYEGEGRNTPASLSVFGDWERATNMAAATAFGYTDDDIRHRLNLFGSLNFDFGRIGALSLGTIFLYQSGYPFSLVAPVTRTDIPEYLSERGSTYNYYFGPNGEPANHERGTQRFNDWWQLDLATRYNFPIFRDVRPFAKVSVLNVLNNDEVITHQTSGQALRDANGNITGWAPVGTCGLGDEPSKNCSSFGRIRDELDYQTARSFQISFGLQF